MRKSMNALIEHDTLIAQKYTFGPLENGFQARNKTAGLKVLLVCPSNSHEGRYAGLGAAYRNFTA